MKEKITNRQTDAPYEVDVTITVSQSTALWLIEIAELHGDTAKNVAARIVEDVARDDRLAHDEIEITVH